MDCGDEERPAQILEAAEADMTHSIEKVGAKLRARMPWLESSRT